MSSLEERRRAYDERESSSLKHDDRDRDRRRESFREVDRRSRSDRNGDMMKPMRPRERSFGGPNDFAGVKRERPGESRYMDSIRRKEGGPPSAARRLGDNDKRVDTLGGGTLNRPSQPSIVNPTPPINRDKMCPLLLRCFWRLDQHHTAVDYAKANFGEFPDNEVRIYTWPDASLRELMETFKNAGVTGATAARRRSARVSFAFVYPDKRGRYVMKEVGRVSCSGMAKADDGNRSLASLHFQTGDFMDIAIMNSGVTQVKTA